MTHQCPHCGTNLSDLGDAFCPECRGPLDEPATVTLVEDALEDGVPLPPPAQDVSLPRLPRAPETHSKGQSDSAYLGEYGDRICPTCGQNHLTHVILRYKWRGSVYNPDAPWFQRRPSNGGWISERKYFLFCSGCKAEQPIDAGQIPQFVKQEHIPFAQKHGLKVALVWCAFIVLIFALWFIGALGSD
jgi:hypothetical protein